MISTNLGENLHDLQSEPQCLNPILFLVGLLRGLCVFLVKFNPRMNILALKEMNERDM